MDIKSYVRSIKGVGRKTEALLAKLDIITVGDLLNYYPGRYDVYGKPVPAGTVREGEVVTITGAIQGKIYSSAVKNLVITSVNIHDRTGTIKAVWFRMPYIAAALSKGGSITLRGRVSRHKGILCMEQPETFYPSCRYDPKAGTMQPVYPLTAGLTGNFMRKIIRLALNETDLSSETLPESVINEYHLMGHAESIRQIHFPKDAESMERARKRLVFEEFFNFITSLAVARKQNNGFKNPFLFNDTSAVNACIRTLPYKLTNAQERVLREIMDDMRGPYLMSRLIQGDVGSGKTVIAMMALILASANGHQGALMAPTEVLARQHYDSMSSLLAKCHIPLKVTFICGSMGNKDKAMARREIEDGIADIIIGTHALISENVIFKDLALAVTDEEHRFGVRQRERLSKKGGRPHVLAMSATPIPRTLAMSLYADMDVSVIDELPGNRVPIKNCVVGTNYRKAAYSFMKKQIKQGRQCYVICPMILEEDGSEAENVIEYAQKLKEIFGKDIPVGQLHGRMKQEEKDKVMDEFKRNEIRILVSTTVIEVGIDVPNATVMLVENAERFGLSQLHQLRGRVGRGKYQSYCIFMSGSESKETMERLSVLKNSNDGFYIAERDLKLRGPGDMLGIRQSGLPYFRIADIFRDAETFKMADRAAKSMISS